MPSFSATSRAPAGIRPVASSASHPSAAAVSTSNRAATSSGASRNASCADGGFVPATTECTVGPKGTSGTPTRASSAANSSSGGAHTRTSAPSSRNRNASPAKGSTSPRDPHVDNTTRISRPPFTQVLAFRWAIMRHDPGLAASPPVRYNLKMQGARPVVRLCLFLARRGPSSRSDCKGSAGPLPVARLQVDRTASAHQVRPSIADPDDGYRVDAEWATETPFPAP